MVKPLSLAGFLSHVFLVGILIRSRRLIPAVNTLNLLEEARAIYRAHGWPDTFRREECRQALLEWDRRKLHSTDSISRVEL